MTFCPVITSTTLTYKDWIKEGIRLMERLDEGIGWMKRLDQWRDWINEKTGPMKGIQVLVIDNEMNKPVILLLLYQKQNYPDGKSVQMVQIEPSP